MTERERLLSLLPQAKYPNALLEVILHPMPIEVTAIRTGVSKRRLQAILLGHDSFSVDESIAFQNALQTATGKPAQGYLFGSEKFSCVAPEVIEESRTLAPKNRHPAVKILRRLLEQETPPDAALMAIDSLKDFTSPTPTYNYRYRP